MKSYAYRSVAELHVAVAAGGVNRADGPSNLDGVATPRDLGQLPSLTLNVGSKPDPLGPLLRPGYWYEVVHFAHQVGDQRDLEGQPFNLALLFRRDRCLPGQRQEALLDLLCPAGPTRAEQAHDVVVIERVQQPNRSTASAPLGRNPRELIETRRQSVDFGEVVRLPLDLSGQPQGCLAQSW